MGVGMPRGDLLNTWSDFTAHVSAYLDHVRRAEKPVRLWRHDRPAVTLTRSGLASERPVLLRLGAGEFSNGERPMRRIRDAIEAGGVVQITRWGVVDGVLEVVP